MAICAPSHVRNRHQATLLRSVLQRIEPQIVERRDDRRAVFTYQMRLTPLDRGHAGREVITIVGRDLSVVGIGFEHAGPLPYRKARLSAADPRLDRLGLGELEMDVTLQWCRFMEPGRYESGGRILRSTLPGLIG